MSKKPLRFGSWIFVFVVFVFSFGWIGGELNGNKRLVHQEESVNHEMALLLQNIHGQESKTIHPVRLDNEPAEAVHSFEEAVLPLPTMESPPAQRLKVNLNKATAPHLLLLPGIGEVKAKAILDHRDAHGPFVQVEDLMNVKGIGPKTFENLQDLIIIE